MQSQSFTSPTEISSYQATVLRSSISLLQAGIKPGRGYNWKSVLYAAGKITGKVYTKRTAEEAKADLRKWALGLTLETLYVCEDPEENMLALSHWPTPLLESTFTKAEIEKLYAGETVDKSGYFYTAVTIPTE